MTPHDVAADESLRLRFQTEVAYLDRTQPSEAGAREDADLLASRDGVRVIAWLWPEEWYAPDTDPFGAARQEIQSPQKDAGGLSQLDGVGADLESVGRVVDRERRRRRRVATFRLNLIIASTARVVGRSQEDLKTHLKWSAHLSDVELERLLHRDTPFAFSVIVSLCNALQLEFTDGWLLVDPQRLARRIDQSVLAAEISNHLRFLTLDNLESVLRKLPRGSVEAGQAHPTSGYRAPKRGSRYWPLYEALAADERDAPDYPLAEIDQLLIGAGEPPLPTSARLDRSWWAGGGERVAGRPQVSAWWAAGYRIRNIETNPSSGGIESIGFEALPGRHAWLANPDRTADREYRVPDPATVPIYPDPQVSKNIIEALVPVFEAAGNLSERFSQTLRALPAALAEPRGRSATDTPDDPDIRNLVEFLDNCHEADRDQIREHFRQLRGTALDETWLTNLMTRARRQDWIINVGTRNRPRWTSIRSM